MVHVEFYGIPRERAGTAQASVDGETLGEILQELAERYPQFALDCLNENGELRSTYIANIDAAYFTRDLKAPIADGSDLIILSADPGG